MKIIHTELPGVVLIEPTVHVDARGFFFESYRRDRFVAAGLDAELVQHNQSRSQRGTLRGLHFQHPHGQVKLCRVLAGEVYDAVVDVRFGSATFGRVFATVLSAENKRMIWIPTGFAHGFCVTSDSAEFEYKCGDYYSPPDERSVLWNDPALGIAWPLTTPIISAKDAAAPRLADIAPDRLPVYDSSRGH